METDHVRGLQNFIQRSNAFDTQRFLDTIGQVWVKENDVKTERFCPQRGCGADPSATDDTKSASPVASNA